MVNGWVTRELQSSLVEATKKWIDHQKKKNNKKSYSGQLLTGFSWEASKNGFKKNRV